MNILWITTRYILSRAEGSGHADKRLILNFKIPVTTITFMSNLDLFSHAIQA